VSNAVVGNLGGRAAALIQAVRSRAFARAGTALLLSLVVGLLLSPGATQIVPRYTAGQFTTSPIRAPYDFTVVDPAASQRRREEAARLVPPVASLDAGLPGRIKARIGAAFSGVEALLAEADRLRQTTDAGPKRLSAQQQSALRRQRAEQAEQILSEKLPKAVEEFERSMNVQLTADQYAVLNGARFAGALARTVAALVDGAYSQPIAEDLGSLERAMMGDPATKDGSGRLAIRSSSTATEAVVASPLPVREVPQVLASLPAAAEILGADFDAETRALLGELAGAQIRPNLVLDPATTSARRAAAAEAALPVSLSFERNQLIIGEGQEVTEQVQVALDHLRDRGMSQATLGRLLGVTGLLFLLATFAFWVADRVAQPRVPRRRDFVYVAASLALAAFLFWLWRAAVDGLASQQTGIPEMALVLVFPFAAIGMLTRFVLGLEVALIQLLLASVIFGMFSAMGVPLAAYTLIAGIVGAHWIAGCTRRGCIMRAGLVVGLASGAASLCLLLLSGGGWQPGSALVVLLGAVLGGLLAGPAVVALSPVVEWAFGYTTNITLLEMVSYEHPLLKRIMVETPGTFQHSLAVSVLADAAARAIGANALLARVGALYHDAGKTENPALFVENQTGISAHGHLAPLESVRGIRAHVADGVRLARAYRLGEQIVDFVREHQGTIPIRYFLEEARRRGDAVNEDDFRYDGPTPRSRETGILMIADQVEAASRRMPGCTGEEYRAMVRKTIDRARQDGQLDGCPLTLHDLPVIEQAMVQVLVGMHHRRVEYPGQIKSDDQHHLLAAHLSRDRQAER